MKVIRLLKFHRNIQSVLTLQYEREIHLFHWRLLLLLLLFIRKGEKY